MHGAAVATLISYILVWLLRLLNIKMQFRYKIDIKVDLLSFVLVISQIAIMYIDQWWSLMISLTVTLIVFIINIRLLLRSELMRGIISKFFKKKSN